MLLPQTPQHSNSVCARTGEINQVFLLSQGPESPRRMHLFKRIQISRSLKAGILGRHASIIGHGMAPI